MTDATESLLALLRNRRLQLATAESCTGGLLGAAITEVPGASDSYKGGFVVYSDQAKLDVLGLDAKKLSKHGAVSAWCVESMAHATRDLLGCDMAIAISGIAGPGGGSVRKPVGTVWMAIAGPEALMDVQKLKLKGDRDQVRQQAVAHALQRAVEMVQEAEAEGVA